MVIDDKTYQEICARLSLHIDKKSMRRSEERIIILDAIRHLPKHFNVDDLQEKLANGDYPISQATVYNTLLLFTEAGILMRHTIKSKAEYELRIKGDNHIHLVCSTCGSVREVKLPTSALRPVIDAAKTRMSADYIAMYMYGLCSRCKRQQLKLNKGNKGTK